MDMYQKRKIRAEKRKDDSKKSLPSVGINWFPGHMVKTKKQIEENLKLVDVVIELIDARIPISSRNPDIEKIIQGKKRIIILNKSDLSDEKENEKWKQKFIKNNMPTCIVNSNTGNGIAKVLKQIEEMASDNEKNIAKGRIGKSIRVMILGIPNVGKSSFINRIAKKNSAEVGNKPGVTKNKQWIRVNNKIELLDTPGVLWPKMSDSNVSLHLAYTGSIKDEILDKVEIAYQLFKYLIENYQEMIIKRYGIEKEQIDNILKQDNAENENIYEVMELIGKKRGAIISGGQVDPEKIAKIILDDFRTGKIGKITIEKV